MSAERALSDARSMVPFAHTIHAAKKYVVSDTLDSVDWNADLIRGRDIGRLERGEIVSPELVSVLKLAMGLEVTPSELLREFTPKVMDQIRPVLRREARNPHTPFAPQRRRRRRP